MPPAKNTLKQSDKGDKGDYARSNTFGNIHKITTDT